MKLILGTPKALAALTPEQKEALEVVYGRFELRSTSDVYINMLCGWTEKECDEVVYIIDKEVFE